MASTSAHSSICLALSSLAFIDIYIYIHIYVYTYIHVYMYTCIHIYTNIQIYIYTCIHIYKYTNIHIYMYTHICTYTYIHIYKYTYIRWHCLNGVLCSGLVRPDRLSHQQGLSEGRVGCQVWVPRQVTRETGARSP